MKRNGFTIVELLVSVTVIAILLALIVPAVQSARETARKMQCAANLRQLALAVNAYEATHRVFPAGTAFGASIHVAILPHIDQQALFDKYDFVNRDDSAVRTTVIPLYLCPSDSASKFWPLGDTREVATSYAGNFGTGLTRHGYNGLFRPIVRYTLPFPTGQLAPADVRDGMSNTIMFAEILHADGTNDRLRVNWNTPQSYPSAGELDTFAAVCSGIPPIPLDYGWAGAFRVRGLPWSQGDAAHTLYNHVLGRNQPSCYNGAWVQEGIYSAASDHAGGVNVVFADGHVEFISNSVALNVWKDYGSRVEFDLPQDN